MTTSERGRRRTSTILVVVTILAACPAPATEPGGWRAVEPDHAWSFPEAFWAHPDFRNEWWYATGHLNAVGDPTREYGFQFTLFRVGLLAHDPDLDSAWAARALVLGHASIGDVAVREHRFSDVLRRTTPFLGGFASPGERPIAWVRAPAGTDDRWEVDWGGEAWRFRARDDARGMAFDLVARPVKPRVFQGPNGYSRKADRDGAASLYYSYTRLETTGTVTLDGDTVAVRGTSWLDREVSTSTLTGDQVGWDWFSLQFDDGRDLMLFALRREDGAVDFESGTWIDPEGGTRYLDGEAFRVEATDDWTSPHTGATYPSRWTVTIGGERFEVVPRFEDQENVGDATGGIFYWEGAVEVLDPDGRRLGRGYVELTGYGEDTRPPI